MHEQKWEYQQRGNSKITENFEIQNIIMELNNLWDPWTDLILWKKNINIKDRLLEIVDSKDKKIKYKKAWGGWSPIGLWRTSRGPNYVKSIRRRKGKKRT
jgi:hypothetical protein